MSEGEAADDCVGCSLTAIQCVAGKSGSPCCVLCEDSEHNGAHVEGVEELARLRVF